VGFGKSPPPLGPTLRRPSGRRFRALVAVLPTRDALKSGPNSEHFKQALNFVSRVARPCPRSAWRSAP
jgi:hypothetical protein